MYTTNTTERSTAATEHSMNESDLELSVESQWPSKSVERSVSAWRMLGGDSKSLSLVERSVGLVVYHVSCQNYKNWL